MDATLLGTIIGKCSSIEMVYEHFYYEDLVGKLTDYKLVNSASVNMLTGKIIFYNSEGVETKHMEVDITDFVTLPLEK